MMEVSNSEDAVIRTERGLTIAGTRITLYDVMDHLKAGWTPKLILNWLPVTAAQLNEALAYIQANREQVEAEYQAILQENQEVQAYWADKNRERLAEIENVSPKPSHEEAYAKLKAWKAQLGLTT